MPNRSSKRGQGPKDFNQIAWEVVQKAIGEMPKEELPDPSKNPAAVTLGEFGVGSVWTWMALDADTKLVAFWMVGDRDAGSAHQFMKDLAGRLSHRVQLTTDGHAAYLSAVENNFGADIDYAMLVKLYGAARETEARYSPAECIGCQRKEISGKPDSKHISTSYVERQNLTMRMHNRRFTRLTNAFSKRIDHHVAAISLHFMYCNFVKIHGTLRCTPAMAAGVTDRLWDMSDVVALLDGEREQRVQAAREKAKRNNEQSYNPFGSALGQ